ncbi:MAG: hypothetical protein AVDCRST_MAG65-1006, partial [uncultured Solirubrobacteraceae bacterium]
ELGRLRSGPHAAGCRVRRYRSCNHRREPIPPAGAAAPGASPPRPHRDHGRTQRDGSSNAARAGGSLRVRGRFACRRGRHPRAPSDRPAGSQHAGPL